MKIADYNLYKTPIKKLAGAMSLFPVTLLCDELILASTLSDYITPFVDLNNLSDDEVEKRLLKFESNDPEFTEEDMESTTLSPKLLKLAKKKYKNKAELHFANLLRKRKQLDRKMLLNYSEIEVTVLNLTELAQFYHEGVWEIRNSLSETDEKEQNPYITTLVKSLTENETLLLLCVAGENHLTFSDVYSLQNSATDFIYVPLWQFPSFDEISFKQLKFTAEDLRPALSPFKEDLEKLKILLFSEEYKHDNFSVLKQLCSDHISHHIVPVQNAIYDSLYISQQRNKNKNGLTMQFCLGVSSAENIVNYYEKSGIIQSYVASETKVQLARHINLQTACMCCFVSFRKVY